MPPPGSGMPGQGTFAGVPLAGLTPPPSGGTDMGGGAAPVPLPQPNPNGAFQGNMGATAAPAFGMNPGSPDAMTQALMAPPNMMAAAAADPTAFMMM